MPVVVKTGDSSAASSGFQGQREDRVVDMSSVR